MSTNNRPTIDVNVPPAIADMINEVIQDGDVRKAFIDDGESAVQDPVGEFLRKCDENQALTAETRSIDERFQKRFGTDGARLKKRWADNDPFALAIQKAARMRKEGKVMKLFDAAGNLLAEKEVAE
jgi:hypothetical protein